MNHSSTVNNEIQSYLTQFCKCDSIINEIHVERWDKSSLTLGPI
jgi:hypothetical protein